MNISLFRKREAALISIQSTVQSRELLYVHDDLLALLFRERHNTRLAAR